MHYRESTRQINSQREELLTEQNEQLTQQSQLNIQQQSQQSILEAGEQQVKQSATQDGFPLVQESNKTRRLSDAAPAEPRYIGFSQKYAVIRNGNRDKMRKIREALWTYFEKNEKGSSGVRELKAIKDACKSYSRFRFSWFMDESGKQRLKEVEDLKERVQFEIDKIKKNDVFIKKAPAPMADMGIQRITAGGFAFGALGMAFGLLVRNPIRLVLKGVTLPFWAINEGIRGIEKATGHRPHRHLRFPQLHFRGWGRQAVYYWQTGKRWDDGGGNSFLDRFFTDYKSDKHILREEELLAAKEYAEQDENIEERVLNREVQERNFSSGRVGAPLYVNLDQEEDDDDEEEEIVTVDFDNKVIEKKEEEQEDEKEKKEEEQEEKQKEKIAEDFDIISEEDVKELKKRREKEKLLEWQKKAPDLLKMSDKEFRKELKKATAEIEASKKRSQDAFEGKINLCFTDPWYSKETTAMGLESQVHADEMKMQAEKKDSMFYLSEKQYKNSFDNAAEYNVVGQKTLTQRVIEKKDDEASKLYMTNDLNYIRENQQKIAELDKEIKGFKKYMQEREALLVKLEEYKKKPSTKEPGAVLGEDGKALSSEEIEALGDKIYEPQRYFALDKVEYIGKQNTQTGCWSHGVSQQLKYRGIDLSPHEVRLYRQDCTDEKKTLTDNRPGDWGQGNPMDANEIISKCRKNVAIHKVGVNTDPKFWENKFAIGERCAKFGCMGQDVVNHMYTKQLNGPLKMEYERAREENAEYLRRSIVDAIAKHRCPVSANFYQHIITIIGIQGTVIKYLDSMSPEKSGVMYGDLKRMYFDSAELSWYEDLKSDQLKDKTDGTSYKDGKLEGNSFKPSNNSMVRGINAENIRKKKEAAMRQMNTKLDPEEKLLKEDEISTATDEIYLPKEYVA